jgi:sulfopyruvate decarboxylase alpha subunit
MTEDLSRVPTAAETPLSHASWPDDIYHALKEWDIRQVGYVPDAGHKTLIKRCDSDPAIASFALTTEEEGIALAAGAWLGGARAALLMQSSGVGNCINMLSLIQECRFPLLMLVTMRGQYGETNPWQVPMGQSTEAVLEKTGVIVYEVQEARDVFTTVTSAAQIAFLSNRAAAVLIGQKLIGAKTFEPRK